MEGIVAAVRIACHSCPAQALIPPDCAVQCIAPGNPGAPFGFANGNLPATWVPLAKTPRGLLVEATGKMCAACPVNRLPEGSRALRTVVHHDSVDADIFAKNTALLQEAIGQLRSPTTSVRVLRTSHRVAEDFNSGTFVDLGNLTSRQLEILQTAVRMGYFDLRRESSIVDLAHRLGCTGPTAHEHLRKALEKVMTALFAFDAKTSTPAAQDESPQRIQQPADAGPVYPAAASGVAP